MHVSSRLRLAAALLVVWLALSPLVLFLGYSGASTGIPYLGVLRGWENNEGINESAWDIAVDENNIYIAGMYFEGTSGFGPTLLIVPRDHTSPVVCQRALVFNVAPNIVDRWSATSLDINSTHVALAGWYAVEPTGYIIFFVAVYRKNCEFSGIVEIGGFRAGGAFPAAVVEFDDDGDIYLLVSPTDRPESDPFRGTIFLYRLDQYLNILGNRWYYVSDIDYSRVSASDIEVVDDAVYVVGNVWQAGPEGIFLMEIDKDTLEATNHTILGDRPSLWVSFPHVAVDSEGYIYIAAAAAAQSDVFGPILFKLDNEFNLVFTEANIMGFTPTHRDVSNPYQGLPYPADLALSDTQVFIVGGIEHSSGYDGFVLVANKTDGNPFYFLKIVSREGDAYSGGVRVNSAAQAVNVYVDCAYITGYAENYYLEYEPLNPTATPNPVRSTTSNIPTNEESPTLEDNFNSEQPLNPAFDQDAYTNTKSNGFYGVLCMSPLTARSVSTSTTTSTTTRTVTSTPTTTVTRVTTATQTAVATRVETEYVFSTVYTTRVVEGTVTRYETVTSVTTVPFYTTFTDTTLLRVTATATTTPTVYATVQTTLNRTLTVRQTTTEAVVAEGYVPWPFLLLPFIPLLLLPPIVVANGRRLTITILEGAAEQPETQPASILGEYFKPSVGKLRRNGKVTFHNKDRATHELELYSPGLPDRQKVFTLKPGEKVRVKIKEPGRYFFRLAAKPEKIGVLEVD